MEAGKETLVERERYTVETTVQTRAALYEVSKRYKLNQGEVLDVIFEKIINLEAHGHLFRIARDNKVAARGSRKELNRLLDQLNHEELRALLEQRLGFQQNT